jgi:hypothetical protein
MLDTVDPPRLAYRLFGYVSKPGVPGTGLSDSFASFSYFGSGVFFLLALYFGRLYRMALLGDLRAQMFYVCLLTGGLHTATHTTTGVIPAYLQLAIILYPGFSIAARQTLRVQRSCPSSSVAGDRRKGHSSAKATTHGS